MTSLTVRPHPRKVEMSQIDHTTALRAEFPRTEGTISSNSFVLWISFPYTWPFSSTKYRGSLEGEVRIRVRRRSLWPAKRCEREKTMGRGILNRVPSSMWSICWCRCPVTLPRPELLSTGSHLLSMILCVIAAKLLGRYLYFAYIVQILPIPLKKYSLWRGRRWRHE